MDEMMQLSQADQKKWYGEFVSGLCAITAVVFVRGRVKLCRNKVEGFIVVPVG